LNSVQKALLYEHSYRLADRHQGNALLFANGGRGRDSLAGRINAFGYLPAKDGRQLGVRRFKAVFSDAIGHG
jgi:hypothetical protein